MIEIKHGMTGEVLCRVDADTLADADLRSANLRKADLRGVDLRRANLADADLRESKLVGANLEGASLCGARLSGPDMFSHDFVLGDPESQFAVFADLSNASLVNADLTNADLGCASLRGCNLRGADLFFTNLRVVDFEGANLSGAQFHSTILTRCRRLHLARGLAECVHHGTSDLDRLTLLESLDTLPDVFLEGCGHTRHEIEELRGLYSSGWVYHSCFISHGEPDLPFAERLLADLRQNNVTCWHYKADMRGGSDWEDQINRAIKIHDKLILVCSRSAVYRKNVVKEILHAIKIERETGEQKLFPIRLDDHILSPEMLDDEVRHVKADLWPGVWVEDVKRKHIPDFSGWDKDNAKYLSEFQKLLEALQTASPAVRQ